MATTEELDKRITRLENMHLWGGIIIIGLGLLVLLKYGHKNIKR